MLALNRIGLWVAVLVLFSPSSLSASAQGGGDGGAVTFGDARFSFFSPALARFQLFANHRSPHGCHLTIISDKKLLP